MKLDIFDKTMLTVIGVLALIGLGGWYYTGTMVTAAQDEMNGKAMDYRKLLGERFEANERNIKRLNENIEELGKVLEPLEEKFLTSSLSPLSSRLRSLLAEKKEGDKAAFATAIGVDEAKAEKLLSGEENLEEGQVAKAATFFDVPEASLMKLWSQPSLAQIAEQNPVDWKVNSLEATVNELQDLAKTRNVELPAQYQFSFSRYQQTDPSAEDTKLLGKQLFAIKNVVTMLFDGNRTMQSVNKLNYVRRTMDEDGKPANATSVSPYAGSVAGSVDQINGTATFGGRHLPMERDSEADFTGIYRVIPIEIQFEGKTSGLRHFLDSLVTASNLYTVNWVQVRSLKPNSPLRGEVLASVQSATVDGLPPEAFGDPTEPAAPKGPSVVFGNETIEATVRLALIDWMGMEGAEAVQNDPNYEKPEKKRKSSRGKRRPRRR